MTIVHIPSPLHDYTGGRATVEAAGATIGELLDDLDRRMPGFRFRVVDERGRVRSTILIYAGGVVARDLSLPAGAVVHIVAALSGG